MKNKQKVILSIIVLLVGIVSFIYLKPESMSSLFKIEYERLNGKENSSNRKYIEVTIPKNNNIVYANYDQIFDILDGSGVIYFGYPECPWCRNAIPVLLEAAKEASIDKIYYLDNHKDRDTKVLKDGKVITEKEGTSNYNKLLEKLEDDASAYEDLNDDSIKRLYYPTVVIVKDGEIISYIEGTVESQDDPYTPLNDKQTKELKDKYRSAMNKLQSCEQDSKC